MAFNGELGRYSLFIDAILSMVKYWVRLNDIKDIPLETISIKEEKAMSEKTQKIWLTCIKSILNEMGMSDSYFNFYKCTTKKIKNLQTKLR